MTTPRTPTRNRRAEILEAAATLFAARGFHGVSIEEIGAAVGISGPAIYRHFSGKEALLSDILLDISERLRAQGARLALDRPRQCRASTGGVHDGSHVSSPEESPAGDPEMSPPTHVRATTAEATLTALLRGHIDFALRNPALIRVHERELDNIPESARRRIRRLQRLYVEEWVAVLTELYPSCSPVRLRAATHAVFGLLNSTPRSAGELPAEAMGPLLHDMARAAISASVPGS